MATHNKSSKTKYRLGWPKISGMAGCPLKDIFSGNRIFPIMSGGSNPMSLQMYVPTLYQLEGDKFVVLGPVEEFLGNKIEQEQKLPSEPDPLHLEYFQRTQPSLFGKTWDDMLYG